jgi:hypothetical protein
VTSGGRPRRRITRMPRVSTAWSEFVPPRGFPSPRQSCC